MSAKTGKQCQFGQDMTYLTRICCLEKFPCKFCGILGIGHARYIIGPLSTADLHPQQNRCIMLKVIAPLFRPM